MPSYRSRLERNGRIVLPAPVRRALELGPSDEIVIQLSEHGAYVTSANSALKRVQEELKKMIPDSKSLVDELIEMRRQDAADE